MIEAELPDGRVLEFPDGTDPAVVQRAVKRVLGVGQDGGAMGYADNIVRQIANGMTFGFADEIAAGANAALGSGNYQTNVEAERRRDRAFAADNPKAALLANLAGGMSTGGAGAAKVLGSQALRQAPRMARALAYPGIGAAEGAVAGAGYADSGKDQTLRGMATGAAGGAALGALAPMIGHGLRKGVIDPAMAVVQRGKAKMARDFVQRSLDRAGLTAQQAEAKMHDMGAGGTLVDVSRNTAALGETVAGRPGAAMERMGDFASQRRGGQYGRILEAVQAAVGKGGKAVALRGEDNPAFRDALAESVPVTQEMVRLLNRGSMRAAWRRAQDIASEQDIRLPDLDAFVSEVNAGRITGVKTELLHYLKKGLDDVIEPKRNAMGMVAPEFGRAQMEGMKQTRYAFRRHVKELNPAYGKALDAVARDKRLDAAFQLGRDYAKPRNTPGVLAGRLARMDEAEQRSFRAGMAGAIEDFLAKAAEKGDDATNVLLGQGPKIRAGFGQAGDAIVKRLKTEQGFMRTDNAMLQNSRTAFRQEARADFEGGMPDAVGAALDAGMGRNANLVARAARALATAATRPPKAVEDQIARALSDRDAGLALLRQLQMQQAVAALRRRGGLTGLTIGTGASTLPRD